MKLKKYSKVAVGLVLLSLFLMPMFAYALETPQPPIGGRGITLDRIKEWINKIAQFLITVSMVLAVIIIIWGGINYMFARGDDKKVEAATKMIKNGIIGAAVILGVGLILKTLQLIVQDQTFL